MTDRNNPQSFEEMAAAQDKEDEVVVKTAPKVETKVKKLNWFQRLFKKG